MRSEYVLENINLALTNLFKNDEKVVLIGEDVADPYGGAFKVSKGISTIAPDRVIATPISEESFTNMAAGMAIMGYRPIVDLMFSDFTTLILDPLLNFASKFVSMYGERHELPMIVRCANGGYRGYGPTHSQSMQKYFMGIPNLSVYEMTPFHDNEVVFKRMFWEGNPCIFFEEKTLYSSKMFKSGKINNLFNFSFKGKNDNWAVVSSESGVDAEIAVICHGGLTNVCLNAVEKLMMNNEVETKLFIPSKLYPCDVTEILDELLPIGRLLIVEESVEGANWGNEILGRLCYTHNGKIPLTLKLLSSKASIIPASLAYEQKVLVSEDDIIREALALME
ncbi:hypothetical protein [Paenibacillus polymyxa]|uniref:hypothetical protein n=1 Tax=Paenibacillus polymyxa TaxID=1406 RepID=UPI00321717CA